MSGKDRKFFLFDIRDRREHLGTERFQWGTCCKAAGKIRACEGASVEADDIGAVLGEGKYKVEHLLSDPLNRAFCLA